MRFIDMFSGIGGFRSALENNGHECIAYSEIDKHSIKSYNALYDTQDEIVLGDITKISQEYLSHLKEENDIVVGGSPCQSFSKDGKRKGFEDVRGTLFFEFAKVVKETQPKYFLFENVYGLMNHDKGNTIRVILNTFNELGYYVDFNVFNSKYYDVPQNRERIYIVGKRKDLVSSPNYHVLSKGKRKIDELHNWCLDNVDYIHLLPTPKSRINTKLLNILESDVSDKYLLPENIHEKLILHHNKEENLLHVKQATKQGYDFATKGDSVNISFPNSKTRRGRVGKQVTQTLQAGAVNQGVVMNDMTVRKLTPLECWRLQGFTDEQFYKAKDSGVSDNQLYKQAGNSVTVNVVDAIVKHLFKND